MGKTSEGATRIKKKKEKIKKENNKGKRKMSV